MRAPHRPVANGAHTVPFHYLDPGQKVMALPTSGFMASQMGTLVTNMGLILHWIFSDPGLYPNQPADCSPFLLRLPLAGLLMQIGNLLAQPRLTDAWNAQRAADPAKGLGRRRPSSITSAT
jgi:hypothetical protein